MHSTRRGGRYDARTPAVSVDVNAILEDLAEGRKERAGISATTVNLVAFVEDPLLIGWISERVATLAERHRCRGILLDASRESAERAVRITSKELDDTVVIQTEQIVLGVRSLGAEELASVVHALRVPSVPAVLLWAGTHLARDSRFAALARATDSLIVDSSRADARAQVLCELLEFSGTDPRRSVRDLAFMRLLPWQDMIAQFFDEGALAAELSSISRVEIAAGSQAEAYYLAGWLSSRLGWKPLGPHAFASEAGQPIAFVYAREGDPRRVRRVVLTTPRSTFTAALQADAEDVVLLTVSGAATRPQRCAPLHDVDVVSLLERAILAPQSGEVFWRSLEAACAILACEGSAV